MTLPQLPGVRARLRKGGRRLEVRAPRVHDVQQFAAMAVGAASVEEIDLTVARWRPPVAGWLGRLTAAGVTSFAVEPQGSGVVARLSVAQPADASLLLAALVRVLRPFAHDPGPELTFAPGLPSSVAAIAGGMRDVLLPQEGRDPHVRRCDVLLVPDDDRATLPDRAVTVHVSGETWTRDGVVADVSVDPTLHRPIGRRSTGATAVATATVEAGAVRLDVDGVMTYVGSRVTDASLGALRTIGAAVGEGLPTTVVRQLNACGVVVAPHGEALPGQEDHLAWQARSVHERRHALRAHGPAAALDAWPSVSVVLVTHRPDHLDHALRQLARLRYPRLEAVIGAHGDAIDLDRLAALTGQVPFPVSVLPVDRSRTLGEALQACSQHADGALVTKMDDDDVYGPEHIWDLVLARHYSGAQIVGKALDWIYLESQDATVFRPTYPAEKYADFVAGGTMLIARADLDAVGGWRPVPRSVDRALLDRVLADGGLVYRTHGLGYVYVRHSAGHTASVRDEHFLTKVTQTFPGLISHPEFGT